MTDGPAFILLSYARPANLQRIVALILQAGIHSRIVVSNNNPDIDLAPYVADVIDHIELMQNDVRRFPGHRFEIARDVDAEDFIFIDDDIFLSPSQIQRLYALYRQDRACPHGVWGQAGQLSGGQFWLRYGVFEVEARVEVLNRVYVCSRAHVERFFELLRRIGKADSADLGLGCDVVLSFCGDGRPYCHDVGPLEECETSNAEDIALWRQDGFDEHRLRLFVTLARALGRPLEHNAIR